MTQEQERYFQSRTILKNSIKKYFEWCDENPIRRVKGHNKDGKPVYEEKLRAYNVPRLCNHLGISEPDWHAIADTEPGNAEYREDLAPVYHWAMNEIRAQERELGLAGFLNHNILTKEASKPIDKTQKEKVKVEVEGPDSLESLREFFTRGK